jgi:integrase
MMFRHGLRACEVITLAWDQVHFDDGTLHITRAKNGTPATHFLDGDEVLRLRKHKPESAAGRFVFSSERTSRRSGRNGVPGSSSHASSRQGLPTRATRCRYASDSGVSRSPRHQVNHGVHADRSVSLPYVCELVSLSRVVKQQWNRSILAELQPSLCTKRTL